MCLCRRQTRVEGKASPDSNVLEEEGGRGTEVSWLVEKFSPPLSVQGGHGTMGHFPFFLSSSHLF